MKTEYRRDMQHSYLVVIPDQQPESSYPLRMITENTIPGLLSCSCRRMDEDVLLYYDVTSRISLKQRCSCKKITGEEVLALCKSLAYTLAELDEYLLEAGSLILEMEYIFVDAQVKEVLFCCVPGTDRKIEESFCSLMEELLPLLDHQNQEGIMIGYGFYHYAVQEVFSLEGFMKQIEACTDNLKKKEEKEQFCDYEPEQEKTQEEDVQILLEEEPEERHSAAVTLAAAGILIGGLSGWYLWRNYPSAIWIAGLLGLIGIVSGAAVHLLTKKKKTVRKEQDIRREGKQEAVEEEIEEGWEEPCFTQILCMPEENTEFFLESKGSSNLPPIHLREKKQWFIGKMADMADVLLPSSAISRLHARIRIDKGHCYLCDMNSRNGTWVNGKVLPGEKEIEIKVGDEIKFADLTYILRKN